MRDHILRPLLSDVVDLYVPSSACAKRRELRPWCEIRLRGRRRANHPLRFRERLYLARHLGEFVACVDVVEVDDVPVVDGTA